MGSGSWTTQSYKNYSSSVGRTLNMDGVIDGAYTAQEMFRQNHCAEELKPFNVMRECRDSEEHPNTFPVILGLDVTGSMGTSAVEVAKKLNVIMTNLYKTCKDIEFMVIGIGDLVYDISPIQISQFESDIRIAEQLDKIWFEGHGGGNDYESYTEAWYMGINHTKLDCLNRGKKGLIITMGDEFINPYLPKDKLIKFTGDELQGDIETTDLYRKTIEKFNVYHLVVSHGAYSENRAEDNYNSFADVIGANNVKMVNISTISDTIIDIIKSEYNNINNVNVNEIVDNEKTNKNSVEAPDWGSLGW